MEPRQLSNGRAGAPAHSNVPHRTNSLRTERESSRRGQNSSPVTHQLPESQYVVYLRLPFPRNGFVDPPQVDWDSTKERYLWRVLSRGTRNSDIDWDLLAGELQVSRAFLLQQAAWLYERELSQIQAQMRRVSVSSGLNTSVPGPSSTPGPQSPGGLLHRPSGTERVPSSPVARVGAPYAAPGSPRPSGLAGPNPSKAHQTTSRASSAADHPLRPAATEQPPPHRPPKQPKPAADPTHRSSSPSDESESLSSSSSSDNETVAFKRLPAFLKKQSHSSSEEDGDEPAFLPFSFTTGGGGAGGKDNSSDLTATVTYPRKGKEPASAGMSNKPELRSSFSKRPGITSKGSAANSAGPSSPSMGSSFSDLSDASVSQSALEEAYLSTMQHGGMASRMSSLSQAVRSRYFPPQQQQQQQQQQ